MDLRLSEAQQSARAAARQFATEHLKPAAAAIDRDQTTPPHIIAALANAGWLGAALPKRYGGGEMDAVSYGLATEEIGRVCSSVRSLVTVHNMASQALLRFGGVDQRERWLPGLCAGTTRIAFALTEPEVGSAANDVRTSASATSDGYVLNGTKVWITYGLLADLFLVIARCDDGPTAFVVERGMPGLVLAPINDALGTRGSMLARMTLDQVRVPAAYRIGAVGAGVAFVANHALDHGRFSVAWGATGLIRACLEACVAYSTTREQGGSPLIDRQLIRRRLTDMLVGETTARALCYRSAAMRQSRDPFAPAETALAKYHASQAALDAATSALHLHGGHGCSAELPVARYLRDATIISVIEGTSEMHQVNLASYALRRHSAHS